jgi:hypothetical protein
MHEKKTFLYGAVEARSVPKLDAQKVIETLEKLNDRIIERFPEAGLARVCGSLTMLARKAAENSAQITRPYVGLRTVTFLIIGFGLAGQVYLFRFARFDQIETSVMALFPALEAAANLLILFGAAAFFLWTLEERLKRRAALQDLYELRSIAHVVDMHQLTKDPTVLLHGDNRTKSSPQRIMNEFQLTRYLEYCAEMHALTGKLAALYAQDTRDPVIIEAVNDIESLVTDLGRKIWQKITILHHLTDDRDSR